MPIGRSARRGMIAGAAISSSRSKKRAAMQQPAQAAPAAPAVAPAPAAAASEDMYAQLEKLGELKEKGILTEAEFDAKKKQILGL